jgi:molybdopterin converting factor subunit 1
MRITVRLFARLREIAGVAECVRDVPEEATARVLWNTLASEYPDFVDYGGTVSTAVNEEYSKMDAVLSDGDEVAFLPPVSGG